MTLKSIIKSVVAVTILSGFGTIVTVSAAESPDRNNSLSSKATQAPTVTAAEIKGSFWDLPYLKKAYFDSSPTDIKDGIAVGELGAHSGNKDMIVKLAQEFADGKHGDYDSLLIAHRGKLLFESYYKRGRINMPHPQASATKSYTSLALGRAIQLGYLTMADLDKPLVSFLGDLDPTKFVHGAEKITLINALTMTTGIRISDEHREEIKKNPSQLKGQGEVQVLLEHSAPITKESQTFRYGMGPQLVMQVIDAVVPGTAKDFIRKELLSKMGITNYRWKTAVSGMPESGWGVSMTSRDMVKWGTLAMNKGKWQGEQLIPQAYIAKATSRVLYPGDEEVHGGGKDVSNQGYGYLWWGVDMKYGNKSYFSTSAQGGGDQYIILVKELDLMVVFTGHNRNASPKQIVAERIIPAFVLFSVSSIAHDTIQHAIDNPARPETDRKLDAVRKPAELLKFVGTSEGDVVLEMLSAGGYYAEILSKAVGSKGKVDAHNNADYKAYLKDKLVKRLAVDGRMENVTELVAEVNEMELEAGKYDSIYLVQRFHDFWDVADGGTKFNVERTLAQFHKALKVDGTIAIVDHAAADGAPLSVGHTLHRIAKDAVIAELAKGGFVLEAEADFLANAEDDGSEPSRGTTNRMVLKFKKK